MRMRVEIDQQGDVEIVAVNTLGDLYDDCEYFISEAKRHSETNPSTAPLHRRFVRVGLFSLFAYAEGVVNRWLYRVLEKQKTPWLFELVERRELYDKMNALCEAMSLAPSKPNLKEAKEVRNLMTHFKPEQEDEAFERLQLAVLETAFSDLKQWMGRMEVALGEVRHYDTKKEVGEFITSVREGGVKTTVKNFDL